MEETLINFHDIKDFIAACKIVESLSRILFNWNLFRFFCRILDICVNTVRFLIKPIINDMQSVRTE